MGKPTGKSSPDRISRLINHEEKRENCGIGIKKLGIPAETIRRVRMLIKHDNLMSEYGRSKLHGEKYIGVLPPVAC